MRNKFFKGICLLLTAALALCALSSCQIIADGSLSQSSDAPDPVAVSLKTDLHDAKFSFTYGELSDVLNDELLAALFTDYAEKTDETTIDLNYNDIKVRYAGTEYFDAVMGLLSDEEKAAFQANPEKILAYYTDIVNAIKTQKPATVYSENFWVDNDTIQFTDANGNVADKDSKLAKAARLYKDFVVNGVSEQLPNGVTTKKGESLNDVLYLKGSDVVSQLTLADIDAIYTSVTPTNETNSAGEAVPVELTRTIEIHLKDDDASVRRAISFRDPADVLSKLNRSENSFTVDSYSFVPNGCVITAVFNAVTDELVSLSYDKNLTVTASVTGEGSLENLGKQTAQFNCGSNMFYQFGWESEQTTEKAS